MIDKISINPGAIQKLAETTRAGAAKTEEAGESKSASFKDLLSKSITEVNKQQVESDQSIVNFLTGKGEGIHETMLTLEKADVSMRLMVQVRNKAVEAYKEIMRMQV